MRTTPELSVVHGDGTHEFDEPETFRGATINLFEGEVLVACVPAHVLGDRALAPVVVAAFYQRFQRTIVLASQDRRGVPTYFGPAAIVAVLARIPFDALSWKQYRFRKPRLMMLPIPIDPLPEDRSSNYTSSTGCTGHEGASATYSVARLLAKQRETRALVPDQDLPETRR